MFQNKALTAIGISILLAVLIWYIYTHNPSDQKNLYVQCTFKALTGWDCPGCGGQRAVHELLHFHWRKALGYNAIFVLMIPYLLLLFYYEIRSYFFGIPKPKNFLTSSKMVWIFITALLIFGLLRNLPWYPFYLLSSSA